MARYLAEVHNLANKGIKGRGKGRKVQRVVLLHPPPHLPQQSFPSPSPIGTPNHDHNTAPQLPPMTSFYGLVNWPAPVLYGYKEEHEEELAFGDRLY